MSVLCHRPRTFILLRLQHVFAQQVATAPAPLSCSSPTCSNPLDSFQGELPPFWRIKYLPVPPAPANIIRKQTVRLHILSHFAFRGSYENHLKSFNQHSEAFNPRPDSLKMEPWCSRNFPLRVQMQQAEQRVSSLGEEIRGLLKCWHFWPNPLVPKPQPISQLGLEISGLLG